MTNKLNRFKIEFVKDPHMSIKDGMWYQISDFKNEVSVEMFSSCIFTPGRLQETIKLGDKYEFYGDAYWILSNMGHICSQLLQGKETSLPIYPKNNVGAIAELSSHSNDVKVIYNTLVFNLQEHKIVKITGGFLKSSGKEENDRYYLDFDQKILAMPHLYEVIRDMIRENTLFKKNIFELFNELTKKDSAELDIYFSLTEKFEEGRHNYAFVNLKKEWEKYKKDNNLTEEDIDRIIKEDIDAYYKKHPEEFKEKKKQLHNNDEPKLNNKPKTKKWYEFWKN